VAEDLWPFVGDTQRYLGLVRDARLEALARAARQQTADLETALWVVCWINGATQKDIGKISKKSNSIVNIAIREFIMRYHPNPRLYTEEDLKPHAARDRYLIGRIHHHADRKLLAAEALGAWAKACAVPLKGTPAEQKLPNLPENTA
jgi:hypothetical protein